MSVVIIENLSYSITFGGKHSEKLDMLTGFRKKTEGLIRNLQEDPLDSVRKEKGKVVLLSKDITIKRNLSISF